MKGDLTDGRNLRWTLVSEPQPSELTEFVREANLDTVDAEFVVKNHHHPEVTVRDTYLLILIHVPTFSKQAQVTRGVPLYFIIQHDHVWCIHYEPILGLEEIWSRFSTDQERRLEYFSDGAVGLALHVISELYGGAFTTLEKLTEHIDVAEDAVFHGNERKMVEEVALLVRDVMDFRKIIRFQTNLFSTIPSHPLIAPRIAPMWARVHGQTRKLRAILESLYESSNQLGNTNRDLLQHKENELLRLLTVYSIFSIPAIIIISPYNRTGPFHTLFDTVLYLGILAVAILALFFILIRARRRRVL